MYCSEMLPLLRHISRSTSCLSNLGGGGGVALRPPPPTPIFSNCMGVWHFKKLEHNLKKEQKSLKQKLDIVFTSMPLRAVRRSPTKQWMGKIQDLWWKGFMDVVERVHKRGGKGSIRFMSYFKSYDLCKALA